MWTGLHVIVLPKRMEALFGPASAGLGLGLITLAGVVTAVIVQPTVGAISDYAVTRWGRRKPFIVIGSLLDIVFLWAVAAADTYLAIVLALVLLQFASNFAQGPFQGYVPDLVPAKQVGRASGLMGVMIVLGGIVGVGIAAFGYLQLTAGHDRVGGALHPVPADGRPGVRGGRDDGRPGTHRGRGARGRAARRSVVDANRAVRLGHGHPARAQLPVADRVAAVLPGHARRDQRATPCSCSSARSACRRSRRRPS